jgi:hypothetical protein
MAPAPSPTEEIHPMRHNLKRILVRQAALAESNGSSDYADRVVAKWNIENPAPTKEND